MWRRVESVREWVALGCGCGKAGDGRDVGGLCVRLRYPLQCICPLNSVLWRFGTALLLQLLPQKFV